MRAVQVKCHTASRPVSYSKTTTTTTSTTAPHSQISSPATEEQSAVHTSEGTDLCMVHLLLLTSAPPTPTVITTAPSPPQLAATLDWLSPPASPWVSSFLTGVRFHLFNVEAEPLPA